MYQNPNVSLILDNHLETLIDVKEYFEALWSVFKETETGYCFHLVRFELLKGYTGRPQRDKWAIAPCIKKCIWGFFEVLWDFLGILGAIWESFPQPLKKFKQMHMLSSS